jgi:hypothetical protein
MGLDMLLILAASGMAVAVIGVVVYRNIPNRVAPVKETVEKKQIENLPAIKVESNPEPEPVSEAPPPFSEDSSLPKSKAIAAPTDTTAIGVSSPFLTIHVPRTVQRTTRSKRKRRAAKPKVFPQDLVTGIPSIESPSDKEPSAA